MMGWRRVQCVAGVTGLFWFSLVAAACGQELPDDGAGEAGGAAESAVSKATSESEESAVALTFEPAVPATWELFEPEVELVGREALLDYLNDVRSRHNLEPVSWDDTLQKAAESHANYILENKASIDESEVNMHLEIEGLAGYTGQTFETRGEYFGYTGACFGEVVAFKPTAVGAARSWLESLYHRFPLLDAAAVHVGYAELQIGDVKVNVMEVGSHD